MDITTPMDIALKGTIPSSEFQQNVNSTECPTYNKEFLCSSFLFANHFVVMGILCTIGACGHILTVATLFRDSKRNVTSLLFMILAVSETGFLAMTVIIKCIPVLCTYTNSESICRFRYYSWPYVIKYALPFALIMLILSVWIILLVTIHRAIAVLIPHRAKEYATIRSVRIQCVLLTIASVIFNLPRFFEMKIIPRNGCTPVMAYTPLFYNKVYNIFYKNVLINIFVNIGPLVLLTILTFYLVREIRTTIRRRHLLSSHYDESQRNSVQLTVLLILVVVVFIVCQIPHSVYALLRVIVSSYMFRCPNSLYYFMNISDALVIFNSSINFFLYCLAGKRFRQHLRDLCWFKKSTRQRPSLSSQKVTGASTPLTLYITPDH